MGIIPVAQYHPTNKEGPTAKEDKRKKMSCSQTYLSRYPFTSPWPSNPRRIEATADSERRCSNVRRAQTEAPTKGTEIGTANVVEHLRSPLLATQRNPAHRMMSPGPIGIRPYNLPYNKCSRNISSVSGGPTRYSVQNRFQSRFMP